MTGKLGVDEITDTAGSGAPECPNGIKIGSSLINAISGTAPSYTCRAWVNFDGTTNTGGNCDIGASGNVSSVTDNGVGDYTINFATAMQDNDYVFAGTIGFGGTNSASQTVRLYEGSNVDSVMTANDFRFKTVQTTDATSVLIDPQFCGVSVFR